MPPCLEAMPLTDSLLSFGPEDVRGSGALPQRQGQHAPKLSFLALEGRPEKCKIRLYKL